MDKKIEEKEVMTEAVDAKAAKKSDEDVAGDGKKHWYIVHTQTGHENKVKVNLEKRIENIDRKSVV